MSILNPFTWFGGQEVQTPTKTQPRRPGPRDMTGGMVANDDMLRRLYHGTYPGLQFASPLCFTPVNLLVQFMGYPTPHSDDPTTQAALDAIVKAMAKRIQRVHRGSLVTGNAWRFPRFDSKLLALAWEAIPDSVVTDILVDLGSEEATAVYTDEQIKLSTGENKVLYVQRKRRFDSRAVEVKWYGKKPANVQDYTAANVGGVLPVNFANDADEGDLRGYSVFARVIRNLKDYHDMSYRISETLAKFRPKQVQSVDSVDTWRKENGLDTDAALEEYDIGANDLILNRSSDKTSFEFLPDGATAALEKALERHFWTVVEGTGIPELFWGPLATGNHASTDTQLEQAVSYADAKRKEFSDPWYDLLLGSLRIRSVFTGETYKTFEMGWNLLNGVSAKVKSEILLGFAQATSALVRSASCTKEQLFNLWELNFPETKPGKYEEWLSGIGEMAVHNAALGLDYASSLEDFTASKTKTKKTDDGEGL